MRILFKCSVAAILLLFLPSIYAAPKPNAPVLSPDHLDGYRELSTEVKELILVAQKLSQKKLDYKFGSANPKNGGMDCSGTINYLLNASNVNNVPRDSASIYQWVLSKGNFHSVKGRELGSAEFSYLKPGDLLFWKGTYKTNRKSPISHVMLYLGKDKQGQPLMFGAGNGHTYRGKAKRGVGMFDFHLADARSSVKFVGYGCIPQINCYPDLH